MGGLTGLTSLLITASILVIGLVIGAALRSRDGTITVTSPDGGAAPAGNELPEAARQAIDQERRVTLVQLSSPGCAPCQQARTRLAAVAEHSPDVAHTVIDISEHPEVASALSVLRTPTTVAYDTSGTEILRIAGVPDADKLLGKLRPHLTPATEL
ncbi:thioredoxin family protein [Haloechinothrix sp. LS1_15]|uniref:thioredoxin family protein n=1 Tax=Haloechinothrix sp. LS1_15 TaxID=2652248 RepID=UPI0029464521|nr:thioredoxin family protein [Haloechinothrix sp. LS1_15]MDV6012463.1 thioredoxin family protein [Haloechinothrix sp. LS1_15]